MQRFKSLRIIIKRRLYLPAITVVMVVITLVVMHGISTFRTLDREWRHWENFLEKNARDYISMVTLELRLSPQSAQQLEKLMNEMAGSLDIAYIGLLDDQGRWVSASRLSQAPEFLLQNGERGKDSKGKGGFGKVKKLPDGRNIFEFSEYLPLNDFRVAVVGLWMTPFEEARKQGIRHALMMSITLLVLGSAAFYFIFVVQNYYIVDKTLAEMKSYTENVVESMASGLVTVDTEGQIVSTNQRASDILGLDTRQLWGKPLKSLIPSQHLNIHEVIQHEKSVNEKEIDCPTVHDMVPLSISATPLKGSEGVTMGAVIIFHDLREIRELQEKVHRSERLASLGRFASGVAHEIRNPLSSIKGFAQYFRDKFETGSEDRSYADIVVQEVERLDRVITQLLNFARPKELNLSVYPLSRIIEHPLQLIHHDLDEKGIKLVKSSIPDDKITVDSDQITQALLNILLNAMESMENGGELRVTAVSKPEKDRVEIRISDTGTGISQENLPGIFDPFFSTKKKGTGLGLAITAMIIEANGGEISVESEEEKGATFKIFLPLQARETL